MSDIKKLKLKNHLTAFPRCPDCQMDAFLEKEAEFVYCQFCN